MFARRLHPALLVALWTTAAHAGPLESAVVAAMKLPEAPNYTWETKIDDDARSYTIDGKTERKEDYSLVDMPIVATLRRRLELGGGNSDSQVATVFKGDERLVIETDDGWKTPAEISEQAGGRHSRGSGGGPGGWSGRGSRGGRGNATTPAYSNLQLTLSRPHDEVAIIVANGSDLRLESDSISGTLSETGAQLLLVHPGQETITPEHANGTFRLWIGDGVLLRYQVTLQGTLAVTTPRGDRREVQVHQRATTTISAVGTTKFEVPEDARKKLAEDPPDPVAKR